MIAIIDYGVGNLFSLCSSLKAIGADAMVTRDRKEIQAADRLILPGVGAFGDAAAKLKKDNMDSLVREQALSGKPLLGICLGMQLLFEKSCEFGEHKGLRLLKGQVVGMQGRLPEGLKIPHIGWNALRFEQQSPLFKYIKDGDCVYFVHSFYVENCADSLIASTEYGKLLTAAAASGNIYGCQFHPEKSGDVGLSILRAFCEIEG